MCGAKLRLEDSACRECGAAQGAAVDPSPSATLDIPAPRAVDAWTSPDVFPEAATADELPPRRAPWVLGLFIVGGLGAGTAVYLASSSDADDTEAVASPQSPPADPSTPVASGPDAIAEPSAAGCPELEALGGRWSFITEVTGSRVVQSSGLNGFYELEVVLEGCQASAELRKVGYTARKFTPRRIQRAQAPLAPTTDAAAGFFGGEFALHSEVGAHGIVEMSFTTHDGRLAGVYRQRGARWSDTGLSGFLEGTRDGEYPRDPVLQHQPCIARCAVACDTAQRETVSADSVQACVHACEADDTAAAHCGDAEELPEAYVLEFEGPAPLSTHCRSIGGCAKRMSKAHPKPPSLGSDRLPDPWQEATMVRAKAEGGPRLVLRGQAGWYLSAPLLDLPPSSRPELLRLYARQLGEARERRYVLAVVRGSGAEGATESFVACRLENAGPRCARVSKNRNDYVSALPDHNLTVGALETAGTPAAVYRW